VLAGASSSALSSNRASAATNPDPRRYPDHWFATINDPAKPAWEILPQDAKPGEVILSKRHELGILSNFAATPFTLFGEPYASVEGFWQMMLYPDPKLVNDPRAAKELSWKYTRQQVAQMTAFEAQGAGGLAQVHMKKLGIDWASFDGRRFPYWFHPQAGETGEHYKLIMAAMRAKLEQNQKVRDVLLSTGDLVLRPDHFQEKDPPPEWEYFKIWMQLRAELPRPSGAKP
jgi:predicted NAD-dependent protein-ADP-ribosyltransferase YbiA (DUF1768 family)